MATPARGARRRRLGAAIRDGPARGDAGGRFRGARTRFGGDPARAAGVGRVDLLAGDLVIEADGFEHHSDRDSYRNDRRRAAALALLGYRLVRFGSEDVVHRPAETLAVLARLTGRS